MSRAIDAFVGLTFFLVGISWVPNFFSWVFLGSNILSRGYFLGPNFFSLVFHGSKFFLVGISWIQNVMTFNKLQ